MKVTRDKQSTLEATVISCNLLAVRRNPKKRKRLALLQTLAILIAVFQYGMRIAGQDEGRNSNRILHTVFHPYLKAR